MQTFRKLPTTDPKTKKHSVQKWNGTCPQIFGSNIGFKVLLQRLAHPGQRGRTARPQFQRARALVEEHARSAGGPATGVAGGAQQARLSEAIPPRARRKAAVRAAPPAPSSSTAAPRQLSRPNSSWSDLAIASASVLQ